MNKINKTSIQIAVKYLNDLNDDGYFEVDVSDNVLVLNRPKKKHVDVFGDISNCSEETLAFNIQQSLEFSGIIDIVPINENVKRYRFRPFWVHGFLVESRNSRI